MAEIATTETRAGRVVVEGAGAEDEDIAEALWEATGARACPQEAPAVRLVARDAETRRFLGVADFFRTFPPEDALFAVAVVPNERRRGVGTLLLQMLARAALRQGKRNLGTFIADDDEPGWQLLRSAGIPVRVYEVEGGCYVELDLVPLLKEAPEARNYTARRAQSEA